MALTDASALQRYRHLQVVHLDRNALQGGRRFLASLPPRVLKLCLAARLPWLASPCLCLAALPPPCQRPLSRGLHALRSLACGRCTSPDPAVCKPQPRQQRQPAQRAQLASKALRNGRVKRGDGRPSHSHRTRPCPWQVLNLAHNVLSSMACISQHRWLRKLDLAHNRIRRIEGLEACSALEELSLSHNRIRRIAGLDGLSMLHALDLVRACDRRACILGASWAGLVVWRVRLPFAPGLLPRHLLTRLVPCMP